jgi:pimeloyl-ACP methyl ester carboxylesterase
MKKLKWLAWLTGLGIIAGLASAWLVGSSFIRPANHGVHPPPANLPCTSVIFPSESSSELHGWLSSVENPRGAVVLLHASGGDRTSMLDRARFLRKAGYTTLLIDFRCHGESKGDARTWGWLESRDAVSAVAWLRMQIPNTRIAVVGTSLGGASALLAKGDLKADAIVAEAVFGSLSKAIWNRVEMRVGNLGADVLSPLLTVQIAARLGLDIDDIAPAKAAASTACPVFVIHAANDKHACIEEGRAIFAACPNPLKEWWEVPGAAHVDLGRFAGAEYERRVLAFLERVLK